MSYMHSSYEHKPFWELSWSDHFAIDTIPNHFVHERLTVPEAYSEPSQTSKIELSANLVYG